MYEMWGTLIYTVSPCIIFSPAQVDQRSSIVVVVFFHVQCASEVSCLLFCCPELDERTTSRCQRTDWTSSDGCILRQQTILNKRPMQKHIWHYTMQSWKHTRNLCTCHESLSSQPCLNSESLEPLEVENKVGRGTRAPPVLPLECVSIKMPWYILWNELKWKNFQPWTNKSPRSSRIARDSAKKTTVFRVSAGIQHTISPQIWDLYVCPSQHTHNWGYEKPGLPESNHQNAAEKLHTQSKRNQVGLGLNFFKSIMRSGWHRPCPAPNDSWHYSLRSRKDIHQS